MEIKQFLIYLLIIVGSTYLIRAIPFALINKKIKNRFIKSFLYYIPYTVLAAMTFPFALYATGSIISASVGLVVAIILSIKVKNLTIVAVVSCLFVFITELIIYYL